MVTRRGIGSVVLIGAMAFLIGSPAPAGATSTVNGRWTGKVSGTRAFVALVAGSQGVLAYVTDGKQVAEWFQQKPRNGNAIAVTSAGKSKLRASLVNGAVRGTVTFGNHAHAFVAPRASGKAGLYRATTNILGTPGMAGWIVLQDGAEHGAVKVGSSIIAGPYLDPSKRSVTVKGVKITLNVVDPVHIP